MNWEWEQQPVINTARNLFYAALAENPGTIPGFSAQRPDLLAKTYELPG